jgi:hypothetical protein
MNSSAAFASHTEYMYELFGSDDDYNDELDEVENGDMYTAKVGACVTKITGSPQCQATAVAPMASVRIDTVPVKRVPGRPQKKTAMSIKGRRDVARPALDGADGHERPPQSNTPIKVKVGKRLVVSDASKPANSSKSYASDASSTPKWFLNDCQGVMKKLKWHHMCNHHTGQKVSTAAPFLKPVNTQIFRDYADVVKCPMDLSTVEASLRSDFGYWSNPFKLVADMLLIRTNCYLYNEGLDGLEIRLMVDSLYAYFACLYKEVLRKYNLRSTQLDAFLAEPDESAAVAFVLHANEAVSTSTSRGRAVKGRKCFSPDDTEYKRTLVHPRGAGRRAGMNSKPKPARFSNMAVEGDGDNKWRKYLTKFKTYINKLKKCEHFVTVLATEKMNESGRSAGSNLQNKIDIDELEGKMLTWRKHSRDLMRQITNENSWHKRWDKLLAKTTGGGNSGGGGGGGGGGDDDDDDVDLSDIYCSVCNGEDTEENDILICDRAGCCRAYHQSCLDPPIKKIPEEELTFDRDWFCWQCDCVDQCLDEASDYTGRLLLDEHSIFKEEEEGAPLVRKVDDRDTGEFHDASAGGSAKSSNASGLVLKLPPSLDVEVAGASVMGYDDASSTDEDYEGGRASSGDDEDDNDDDDDGDDEDNGDNGDDNCDDDNIDMLLERLSSKDKVESEEAKRAAANAALIREIIDSDDDDDVDDDDGGGSDGCGDGSRTANKRRLHSGSDNQGEAGGAPLPSPSIARRTLAVLPAAAARARASVLSLARAPPPLAREPVSALAALAAAAAGARKCGQRHGEEDSLVDPVNIVSGSRRRKVVNYLALSEAMFGNVVDVDAYSDEDEYAPTPHAQETEM